MMNIAQIGVLNSVVTTGGGGGDPITYFGSASNPLDNGSQGAATPVDVTPPASMVAGQLVLMTCQSAGTISASISNSGGQSWNALTEVLGGGSMRATTFWCVFNGTWSANPSVTTDSGASAINSVMMHVFSPPPGHTTWGVDVAQTSGPLIPSGGVITIPSKTAIQNSTITHVGLIAASALTYSGLSGAGWAALGSVQYRNTFSSDMTGAFIYKIQTSAGATGSATYTPSPGVPITYMSTVFYSS